MNKRDKLFWDKVSVGDDGECWPWLACFQSTGVGTFWDGERMVSAHRYAWISEMGPIPDGVDVLRSCGNLACCNPGHMRLGASGLTERFWSFVVVAGEDECWEWGGYTAGGHGRIDGIRAHRYSYELANGPIPDGSLVCHSCDNPLCVNPRHLWLGSHTDNMDDMMTKGRSAFGERSGTAVLSEADVYEMKRAYLIVGGVTQQELADRYGISRPQVSHIMTGKQWAHVVV